jgi:hypothetical protein
VKVRLNGKVEEVPKLDREFFCQRLIEQDLAIIEFVRTHDPTPENLEVLADMRKARDQIGRLMQACPVVEEPREKWKGKIY